MRNVNPSRILVGPLSVEVARFGLPLAFGMGLQTCFNLVDAYVISRLDSHVAGPALGAIGLCDQISAVGTIISYGLSVAGGALLSQRQGRGDVAGVRRAAWQSLWLVSALGLIFGLFGLLFAEPIIRAVVGAKGEVAQLSVSYLRVMMGGSFTIFLLLHLTTIQRALGSSKTPATLLILANVLNFVLAVLFVYGPGPAPDILAWGPPLAKSLGIPRMELLGAAWATVIARSVVLLPLFAIVMRRFGLFSDKSPLPRDSVTLKAIARMGWPASAQLVVRILAMLMVHSLVARAYTTDRDQSATTALGIVFRLETLALFIGLGWGSCAQTFVGQNLGAANPERAKMSGYYAAIYNSVMMGSIALLYSVYGSDIVRFFDTDPYVLTVAQSYLHWVGLSYIGLGIGVVLGAAIQGAGAALQALWLDTLVVVGLQLPLSLAVLFSGHSSYRHIWQVIALTYFAFALVYLWSYRRGRFLRPAII